MPTLTDEIRERPRSGKSMSNFDGWPEEGMAADLKAGMIGSYFGWNFCCDYVWFGDGEFHAAVLCHHVLQAVVSAPSLEDLMREVSSQFGWD